MHQPVIQEIFASQEVAYKTFFEEGLTNDEDNFRITPADAAAEPFPTQGRQDSFTLGAFIDGQLVGIVSFQREGANREKLRHKGLLFRMYVSSKVRGQGVGKLLVANLLQRVRQIADIEQVNLTVATHNQPAKNLYGQFGFRIFSSEQQAMKWKGKYFGEDQMALQLKNGA